jgi:acetyl esterase/lipase
VIFVTGFSDLGAEKMLGSRFKDMGSFVSWAQLVAVSGLVGITYANRDPGDVHEVLHHVQRNAALLGIDGNRIGVWACSGHGPNALSVLMEHGCDRLTCAVLAYAYTLDLDGSTRIADAAKQFRFVTPAADKSSNDLPRDLPLFVARAGRDEMPGLNDALDRFVGAALALNLPVTLINNAVGPHAFDLFDDTRTSRDIVEQVLAFLQFHLSA